MDTEQPDTGSEQTVEDRLASFFGAPQDDGPVEQDDAPMEASDEQPEDQADTEEQPESPEDDGLVDIDLDGAQYRVPPALKDAVMAQAKFTQEMQQLSAVKKSVLDRQQFLEAREMFDKHLADDMNTLAQKKAELQRLETIDISQLQNVDTPVLLQFYDRKNQLAREVQQLEQGVEGKRGQFAQAYRTYRDNQWNLAVQGARQVLGNVTQEDDAAALAYVKGLGFSDDEMKTTLADPRVLVAVFQAARLQKIQAGKGQALQKAQKAPPVVKPGASQGNSAIKQNQYKKVRESLKKSGSVSDAARLFLMRG